MHKVYSDTHDLFASTKSQIYDKERRNQVKVIIFYKHVIESNTFLFGPTDMKIGHSLVSQDQVVPTYVHTVAQ